jgi:hypothetical protein
MAKKTLRHQIESNMDGNGEVIKQTTVKPSGRVGRSYSVGVGRLGELMRIGLVHSGRMII